MNQISAAILAGGRATRFGGADKGALVVGGVPILVRQLRALADVAGDIRIIANDAARYGGFGVPVTPDAVEGGGALGGLYTALVAARGDRVIVLACDMPFVPAALLARLVAESTGPDKMDADAVVPRTARGLEPLCALYRTRAAARAKALIDRGELRLTGLLNGLRVREIGEEALAPYGGGALFENVNTPHDYARARDLLELDEKPSEDRITE
jgi:molybdopterin-guanine dinucleotide biosynthesis protein A